MRPAAPRAEAAPTQMIALDELKKPESGPVAGGATEMLQWYGMLRCTAGPLAPDGSPLARPSPRH